jgi:hypothetical protein
LEAVTPECRFPSTEQEEKIQVVISSQDHQNNPYLSRALQLYHPWQTHISMRCATFPIFWNADPETSHIGKKEGTQNLPREYPHIWERCLGVCNITLLSAIQLPIWVGV